MKNRKLRHILNIVVVVGCSGTGMALHIPAIATSDRVDFILVVTRDKNYRAANYNKVVVHLPNGSTTEYGVIGTALTDQLHDRVDLIKCMCEYNTNVAIVSVNNQHLDSLIRETTLFIACSRDGIPEYAKHFNNIEFAHCVDVVVFDNAQSKFEEWKKCLAGNNSKRRITVHKGIAHCVVPQNVEGDQSNTFELHYYPQTRQPYVVYPPLITVKNRMFLPNNREKEFQKGYNVILTRTQKEFEYHLHEKVGLNMSHQLICALAYCILGHDLDIKMMAKNRKQSDVEVISNLKLSTFYDYWGRGQVVERIKQFAAEFYECYLKEHSEQADLKDFIFRLRIFLLDDLKNDNIGRGIKDAEKFNDYQEYYENSELCVARRIREEAKKFLK